MTAPPANYASNLARGSDQLADSGASFFGLLSLLPPQFRMTYKYFGGYPANFLPLVASATQNVDFTVDKSTDFIITFANCTTVDSTFTTLQAFAPVLVNFRDSASTSTLFQSATHASNVYGSGPAPGLFPAPYVVQATVTLTTQHQNQVATNIYQYVVFSGFKSVVNSDVNDPRYNPFLRTR